MNAIHTRLASAGFVRPTQGRIIGGVCAGVAQRYQLDPWAVRLIFAMLLFIPGSQLILYPIAWILMPDARFVNSSPAADPRSEATSSYPQDTL